jgi:hypothetical protein
MLFALGTPKTLWNAPLRFDGCARRFNRISRREYTSVVNDILHANCLAQRNLRNVYPEVAAYALQHQESRNANGFWKCSAKSAWSRSLQLDSSSEVKLPTRLRQELRRPVTAQSDSNKNSSEKMNWDALHPHLLLAHKSLLSSKPSRRTSRERRFVKFRDAPMQLSALCRRDKTAT